MPSSRYAKFNPFGGSQLTDSPISEEPLQFSNIIPDSAFSPLPGSSPSDHDADRHSKKEWATVGDRHISSKSTNDIAYGALDGSRPPRRRRTSNSLYRVASSIRDYAVSHFSVPAIAAPWEHGLPEKYGSGLPPSNTVRYFDYRRQRRRLFMNSSVQWLITAGICAAMASCLYGFSTVVTGLSTARKEIFNALMTGLSLCLGLNLASSLGGYAQMMRWRFLASGYRTLQDFELLLNCDSQTHVFRLIWAGRTRGRLLPNKTQVLAAIWLLINIAVQIFTALLGLTYSTDVSSRFVHLTYGNVSIPDLSYIGNSRTTALYAGNHDTVQSLLAETATANEWGITGQDFHVLTIPFDEYLGIEQSIYTDGSQYWYRFIDRSPLSLGLTAVTLRTVNTTATCQSFPITYGGYAGFQTDNASIAADVTWVDGNGKEHTWSIPDVSTGATTWMSNMTSDCGPRCIQIYALQTADNSSTSVPEPRFWSCLSTVSHVDNADLYPTPEHYRIADTEAQVLAGAIGWSGVLMASGDNSSSTSEETNLQMVGYPASSQWSPPGNLTAEGMALLVMKFTAGAIAAIDSNGPRLNVTGVGPAPAQVIDVEWRYAGSILSGIPVAQGLVLLAVILLADKTIIKDTSHLSMARLLRPIVDKLGDTGCLLTGDEIAERLGNIRVIYGVRDPRNPGLGANGIGTDDDDDRIRHLDIIEETEGLGFRRRRMPEGRYDGVHPLRGEDEKEPLLSTGRGDEADRSDRSGNEAHAGNVSRSRSQWTKRRMSI
ncbi:hypothetical protein AYO21_02073 [Fonsecaea monophora]|uniref:Uncharacterized protein n=1 Tax=Fonsecaea monophora TaxID=254056 RepID=A0A177FJG8_9EURO|nr:hypothetical protein AYO21_02073 [Fonsecaea monophora]OAG43846.1 hypothetical protein AYO21_02073 [Fonsecaea monophora]